MQLHLDAHKGSYKQLYLQHDFHNMIFKIQNNFYIASVSAHSPQTEKFWAWTSTGLIWLRIGTGEGRLWTRLWNLGIYKMRGILVPAEEGLISMELVS